MLNIWQEYLRGEDRSVSTWKGKSIVLSSEQNLFNLPTTTSQEFCFSREISYPHRASLNVAPPMTKTMTRLKGLLLSLYKRGREAHLMFRLVRSDLSLCHRPYRLLNNQHQHRGQNKYRQHQVTFNIDPELGDNVWDFLLWCSGLQGWGDHTLTREESQRGKNGLP